MGAKKKEARGPGRPPNEDRESVRGSGGEGHPFQMWFTVEEWDRVIALQKKKGAPSIAALIRAKLGLE